MTDRPLTPTDEKLVAFLDGELDADARARVLEAIANDSSAAARLAAFDAAGSALREAMAPLVAEAPKARMEAKLSALLAEPTARAAPRPRPAALRYALMAAAAVVLVSAGVVGDRVAGMLVNGPAVEHATGNGEWREAVAGYFALYTADTLSGRNADANGAALERVNGKLGLGLTRSDITLPDVQYAGSVLFGYEGKALAQIAYVDPDNRPIALCIIANGQADAAPQSEVRDGFNVVHWAKDKRGYMLIGRASPETLGSYADLLRKRI